MEITHEHKYGCSIYYLQRRIDIFNSERMKKQLMEMIKENETDKVIFNLKEMEDIDSIGIAFFIIVINKFQDTIHFRLCEVSEKVNRALNYTQIGDMFKIDVTENESISMLNKK